MKNFQRIILIPTLMLFLALVPKLVIGQTTPILDVNFENQLIALNIDNAQDGFIDNSAAAGVTFLDVSSLNISDLSGIEAFVDLMSLVCFDNQLTSLDVSMNPNLLDLNCRDNQLINLDISTNTALLTLNCSNNQLTNLDVSMNTALTDLIIANNQITSLDVSMNTNLTGLFCEDNQLTNLDVSMNTALTYLTSANNQITSLDVSMNPNLTLLFCEYNQLTNLDVSMNTNLTKLFCHNNQLTNLDLSMNTALTDLINTNNQLTSLDLRNINLAGLTFFMASANPYLTCVLVDDPNNVPTNISNGCDPGVTFSTTCTAPMTAVPDINFENELIALGIDNPPADGFILNSAALGITSLDLEMLNISNLAGIEAFVDLTSLYCGQNQLTNLDLTSNTALTELNCDENQLTSLDLTSNTALTELYCNENQLTSLDLTSNTALTELYCNDNQLMSLDLTSNTALTLLENDDNPMTSLDLSMNTALTELYCNSNQLMSLDLTTNTALTSLECGDNQFTSLDFSANTALVDLSCNNNPQLSSLDLRNINLALLTAFGANINPNLTCVLVDDPNNVPTNISNGCDPGVTFSTHCGVGVTAVPDIDFENKLIALGIDNAPADGFILNSAAAAITTLDVGSSSISDMSGIEAFVNLTTLHFPFNQVSSFDLSANTSLTTLNFAFNQVTSFDLSANTALVSLNCDYNQLSNIDVSMLTALEFLNCGYNLLTSLDVNTNTSLTVLRCESNQIANLDVSNNPNITDLYCFTNQIASLDLTANTALTYLQCYANQLTELNLKNINLAGFTTFDTANNPNLSCVSVDDPNNVPTIVSNGCDAGVGFSTNCATIPTNIMVEMTTVSNAFFTWDAVAGATFYQIKYRLKGTTNWSTVGSSNEQKNVANLTAKKYYQYKLRSRDANNVWSDFSDIGLFYTSTCDVPTGVASIYLDNTRMRIRWDNDPNEIKAKVRYRESGTATWYTQNSTPGQNFIYINNLTANATYQYRVRSNCSGNDWSAYSALYSHNLATPRMAVDEENTTTKIYPNPTREYVNIDMISAVEGNVNINIYTTTGQMVYAVKEYVYKGKNQFTVNLDKLSNGTYMVEINDGKKADIQRLVVLK